jgi:hypothetical protein
MKQIKIDSKLLSELKTCPDVVQLNDDKGDVVGYFFPPLPSSVVGTSPDGWIGFTEEELDEASRESEEGSITTAELLQKVRSV